MLFECVSDTEETRRWCNTKRVTTKSMIMEKQKGKSTIRLLFKNMDTQTNCSFPPSLQALLDEPSWCCILRLLSFGGLTLLSGFSLSRPFLWSLWHFFFWYFFLSWQTKCFLLCWYVKFFLPSKISCDNENSISTASSGLYQYPSVGSEHCPKFCR